MIFIEINYMKNFMFTFVAFILIASSTAAAESHWLKNAERDWQSLPALAQDAPIPQEVGYLSREVAENVYVVTDGLYQAMFVITDKGVVVVDAPPSIGSKLLAAIKATTDKPVTHFIYSHSHIDHVGAANQFSNAKRIGQAATAAKLKKLNDPKRPAPTQIVSGKSKTLTIGGTRFQLDYHGDHHEPGNLYIYLPQTKVLMVVDIVYPGWVPFTNLGMAENIQGFIDAHDEILRYDFTTFVGGHLSRVGKRSDIEMAKTYVDELVLAAQEGQKTVDFMAVAQETGFANRWLLVKTYMDRVAEKCSEIMIPKWSKSLAGSHVSTPGHCWIMQEHLNINGVAAD
jgi:glyoxylase-like metal-dependent hydrolase (beta-lactamase superfamily II)